MIFLRSALIGASALVLAACGANDVEVASANTVAATPAETAGAIEGAPGAETESEKLSALFAAADEANLKLNPISALFRGDMRYADRIGDFLTDEYVEQDIANAKANLAGLAEIDRDMLNATDRIAYDVFQYNQEQSLKGNSPEIRALTEVRPVNHFSGFHTFYPTFASGQGSAPFATVEDYENNVARHKDYVAITDRSIDKFREGMASGVFETQLTITNVIEQLNTQLGQGITDSPLWGPMKKFPDDFSDEDKARLEADHQVAISEIYAVHARLRDFLVEEYLPVARESVGLSQMKGGDVLYAQMIENTTTLPLTADYLHNLGLSEVKRILEGMEGVKQEVGFDGTLQEFFEYLRTDPKFQPESREWLTQDYYRIGKIVDAKIDDYFSLTPETPLEIRPYEPFREKFQAGGSYQAGSADGSRPGIFYFNAYDLPSRNIIGNTTLYLHEGAPGHHFQISLARENEDIPAFMRFGGNTAYVEGWALYSETIGYEMGLFDDPYQRMGTLADEQLRAMRLVVDTGLHTKGWTRDQAIQYMIDNSSMGQTDATAEVERYIAIPTQALAYKVGALKIQELREKAETALGDDFDIKGFHAQVLDTGALPLPVLEKKIEDWIASQSM
ncbi:DUF885 domain-containing protein [Pontixanthobacter aestiaquae]|uniref:DUF885 family protein n=1 Tax=Pontixanthobacter aestiaquae TaxID=1509367 RepID=A0A844Z4J0_9SPHN|nr:DUF885 domain-containing protein [Pontixanthobacter aestiaquae]MDN3646373.1 DUF885 domain-containing protein [Pontixanthobacter aestiaquae]MXO82638.1 DUF885 family protein [Pontixanthobacter aestiaquae]